jgi:16S rRNA (cytosine967-C5)-methyltransferase
MGTLWLLQGHSLPDWHELKPLANIQIQKSYQQSELHRAIYESIPDWLDQMGEKELGDSWPEILHSLNKPAPLILRVNTLKADIQSVRSELEQVGIFSKALNEEGLYLLQRKNIFQTPSFKSGHIEVQDYGSQQIAHFMEVKPGICVIDACAGAGGKSLHMAVLMKNKGQIISLDIYEKKLSELQRRARRNGVHIIETKIIESKKTIKRLHGRADRLLLDVPCSGLGVLRRNPDAKWKLTPAWMEDIKVTQQNILQQYASMVKPGGKLIYATCSIFPGENENQVHTFLQSEAGQDFFLEDQKTLLPHDFGYDGFFMARLIRAQKIRHS